MVSQIQTNDNLALMQSQKPKAMFRNSTSFGAINEPKNQDTFESQRHRQNKRAHILEALMLGATGASVAAFAVTKKRMGDIIKFVGQDVPKTTKERLGRIFKLASVDSMTGLFNKQSLVSQIPKEFKEAIKNGEHFSVAMLDMDNFKGINEVFSHEVGDIVLMRIAENINEVAKKYGIKAYRYGGEEFVVSMRGKNGEEAKKILDEIANGIKKDDAIQNYLPQFTEEAGKSINFLSEEIEKFKSIFPRLKSTSKEVEDAAQGTKSTLIEKIKTILPKAKAEQSNKLAQDITSIIENYIAKYDPSDKKALEEILSNLKSLDSKELKKYLNIQTKVGNKSTLGNELNKIYTQYNWKKPDLEKWVSHLKEHSLFTVSSGIASVKDGSLTDNGMMLVKIADEALGTAKNNGKNVSVMANDEIIQKVIDSAKNKK